MENKWKYTFTLFYIISCVSCDPNPVLRSPGTARGLSMNRENSGQMSVNAEDLMAEPEVEHVGTLEQPKIPSTTPPPVSIVQPVAPTAMKRYFNVSIIFISSLKHCYFYFLTFLGFMISCLASEFSLRC